MIELNSMTKRFATLLLCLLAAVSVGACQTIAEKRKIDYKSTRTLPPLDIPPDLATPEGTKGPEQGGTGPATLSGFVSGESQKKAPGSSDVLPAYDGIRIERAGQIRWLVVKLLCWLTFSALAGFAYRKAHLRGLLSFIGLVVLLIALTMVYTKPF